jgi:uncharacterized membrane protein
MKIEKEKKPSCCALLCQYLDRFFSSLSIGKVTSQFYLEGNNTQGSCTGGLLTILYLVIIGAITVGILMTAIMKEKFSLRDGDSGTLDTTSIKLQTLFFEDKYA